MDAVNISELENLIQLKDKKIIATKMKPLTAPGENYGSLMLSLDITVESSTGVEQLNLVAKTLPPNPEMQEMFNCSVTFPNEVAFYKTIIPALQSLQRERGVTQVVNFAAKCHGSRLNLHGVNDQVDKDAFLILENLKVRGFVNLDRTKGFDLVASKLVLKDLAQMHAVGVALKLQKPNIFELKIKPYLPPFTLSKDVFDDLEMKYMKIINSVPKLRPYLDRLKKVNLHIYPAGPPREPFATISHNDCWVNNTMVKVDETGTPIENKLVDFQICDYGSPAKDVLFFLFSSVQSHVLKKYFDELINFYYDTFTSVLLELKCDIAEFSREAFDNELTLEARNTQFVHTVLMLFPIFAPKGTITDIANTKPSDIGNVEPTDLHKEKLVFVVEEFAKRNWI